MSFPLVQNSAELSRFRTTLLRWFARNRRPLPWRVSRDPYRIWVSEIMLQQTRVAAVLNHYREFLRRFPDVRSLAQASQSAVLAAWSGLGYYRRARAMHAAAQEILQQRHGVFPASAAEWRHLPGIGRYTAAAIASIAFAEPVAVLDGNVERILGRLSGSSSLSRRQAWDLTEKVLSPKRPGDFNQAMMELGALVCLPGQPNCPACPISRWCATRGSLGPSAKERRVSKRIAYSLAERNGQVYLLQRPANASLMAGMWELPECAWDSDTPDFLLRHAITITDYRVAVYRSASPVDDRGRWMRKASLPTIPLTGLARKILRRAGVL